MLLTQENLFDRLQEHCASATRIDLATAWSSPGVAQRAILDSDANCRAIIGIAGNVTPPPVLRDFDRRATLRIPEKSPLFHPKFILFHSDTGKTIAWIGSANLTQAGYEQNRELVFEYEDDGTSLKWFEEIWSSLDENVSPIIDDYETHWKPTAGYVKDSKSDLDLNEHSSAISSIFDDLHDWDSFVKAIEFANYYWKKQEGFSVDGEICSWMNTINLGNLIIRRNDLNSLSQIEFKIVMGLEFGDDIAYYGLLGSMKGAANARKIFHPTNKLAVGTRSAIDRYIKPLLTASFDDFSNVCSDFIENMSNIEGVSGGVATRLIALARPEWGVSVNDGSRRSLSLYSGLPISTLGSPKTGGKGKSYLDLIEFLQEQPWYASPQPRNNYERSLAASRGALLDALVYEPT